MQQHSSNCLAFGLDRELRRRLQEGTESWRAMNSARHVQRPFPNDRKVTLSEKKRVRHGCTVRDAAERADDAALTQIFLRANGEKGGYALDARTLVESMYFGGGVLKEPRHLY